MKTYDHYSFDLWLTLIKSNPEFKEKRIHLFDKFNEVEFTKEELARIVRMHDLNATQKCEITGGHIDTNQIIYNILKDIKMSPIEYSDILSLNESIQQLFFIFLPTLFDSDTKEVLKELRSRGITMNILSNTGFINGDTLNHVLVRLGIEDLFLFKLYSDKLHYSKPNPYVFNMVKSNIYLKKPYTENFKIAHVGDNPRADGGCTQVGMDFIQINSNNSTIKDLIK
jgi:putative hydrolase of the HAD superfamily